VLAFAELATESAATALRARTSSTRTVRIGRACVTSEISRKGSPEA
jgi:hypothetical protein